jgi:predicted  nucleic acid-binding Zn-ribbon protein
LNLQLLSVSDLSAENSKIKEKLKQLNKELSNIKNLMKEKDASIDDLQKRVTRLLSVNFFIFRILILYSF